ncbi:MAG: RICIN domain-containing protein [Salinivirgaceae bacterium]|nr:RICIN domain-containing protein [Salinivirgaceae bacterium]
MKKLLVIVSVCLLSSSMLNAQRVYKPNGGKKTTPSSSTTSSTSVSTPTSVETTVTIPKKEYLVRVAGTNAYWDIPGHPDRNSGSNAVQMWGFDNGADRKVMFIPAGDGFYYIKFSHNGYYLDVKGGNLNKDAHLQIWQPNRTDAQKFKVLHKGNGKFKLVTVNGLAVDCEGGGWKNGVKLQLWDDHNGQCQTFEIVEAGTKSKFYGN